MGEDINKLYIKLADIPILSRTIKVFNDSKYIDKVILVVNQEDIEFCKQVIVDSYGFEKVEKIIGGGESRQQSVSNGINETGDSCKILLIHDGARPFVREEDIKKSVESAMAVGAACLGVPVIDTIREVDSENFALKTLDRASLYSIQTPQTFQFSIIKEGHKRALRDGFTGTDDGVLVERLGIPLKIVVGSYENIKITTKADLELAKTIINKRNQE